MGGAIFALLLALSPAQASSEPRDGAHWLEAQFETVSFLQVVNAGNVAGLRNCVCYELALQGKTSPACADLTIDTSQEPDYVHEDIRFSDGENYKDQDKCTQAIKIYLLKPIANRYEDMRRDRILMQPGYAVDDLRISQGTPTLKTMDHFITTKPSHPVHGSIYQQSFAAALLKPVEGDELSYYYGIYTDYIRTKCVEYFDAHQAQLQEAEGYFLPRMSLSTDKVCDFLTYGVHMQKSDRDVRTMLDTIFMDYYLYLKNELVRDDEMGKGLRVRARESYLRNANGNPLLLLVSSAHPSLEELANGLKIIEGNARDRQAKAARQAAHLKKKLKQLESSRNLYTTYIKNNLLEYAEIENGFINTRSVLKGRGWSDEEIASAQAEAMRWSRSEKIVHGVAQMAALSGIIYVCMSAPEAALVMQWGCYAGLALPVNTYFLYQASVDYDQTLRDFFMATEPYQALQKLEKFAERDAAIRLAASMLPAGLMPQKALSATRVFRGLPKLEKAKKVIKGGDRLLPMGFNYY